MFGLARKARRVGAVAEVGLPGDAHRARSNLMDSAIIHVRPYFITKSSAIKYSENEVSHHIGPAAFPTAFRCLPNLVCPCSTSLYLDTPSRTRTSARTGRQPRIEHEIKGRQILSSYQPPYAGGVIVCFVVSIVALSAQPVAFFVERFEGFSAFQAWDRI